MPHVFPYATTVMRYLPGSYAPSFVQHMSRPRPETRGSREPHGELASSRSRVVGYDGAGRSGRVHVRLPLLRVDRMRLPAFAIVALLAPCARFAMAQGSDTTRRGSGTTVSGVVRDSLAQKPLAGAMVQLASVDSLARFSRIAISDSLGRFTLRDVPDGRHFVGLLHPLLDSLGIEPPFREVVVEGHRSVRVDLAIPSPARLRTAICGPRSASTPGSDSVGIVVGRVRDARDGAPLRGVAVTAEWLELLFTRRGVTRRIARRVTTTGESGRFAFCDVPSPGSMTVIAGHGADSTDRIEVRVEKGFLRRELYVGPARVVVTGDTVQSADTLAPPPRIVRMGDGRLSGTVLTADGRPLAGAQVSIHDGPETRANDLGQWTLVGAPLGTRMLEVRAISYYPDRRAVDVVAGAAPVRVTLSTLKAVLDTVRIAASRMPDGSGFEERRRNGMGRYLTAEDIARRTPIFTSELLRNLPGVRVDMRTGSLEKWIAMRGMAGTCSPSLYVDGAHMPTLPEGLTANDIDMWADPDEIVGIEVYVDFVPPQFRPPLSGCGSIVIWTKRRRFMP